ncbi:MAG: tetratricopeptide repeat protein, partial [Acidobacteriota bacterium]
AAAAVTHPNIATVHEVDEANGVVFIAMELVEGKSLRELLSHGAMPINTVTRIAREVAEGLARAHQSHVIHRDLKPENIIVGHDGHPKILDFGLAKLVAEHVEAQSTGRLDRVESSEKITTEGKVFGTPSYMSPEQVRGEPLDTRSDLFSFGVLLFELCTGQLPFRGRSMTETFSSILRDEPGAPSEINPRVPGDLERITRKCMEKDPGERYQDSRDLVLDLQEAARTPFDSAPRSVQHQRSLRRRRRSARVAASVLLVAAALAVIPGVRDAVQGWLQDLFHPVPARKHIAVLPFAFSGGDPENLAFAEGLTEVLTAKLARLSRTHDLQVAPASEVRLLEKPSVELARAHLGVNLAITGHLQRIVDEVRIAVSLVDADSRRQLRADTIEGSMADPFALEDQVVEGVVKMLEVELQPREEEVLRARGTTVARAYDFYLQGRGYLRSYEKPQNIDSAITVFQRALAVDANYAGAHAGLGMAYWHKFDEQRDQVLLEKATASCRRALMFDENDPEGHVCLGMVYEGTGRYQEAITELEKATRLEPASDEAFRWLARAYKRAGRLDEAEKAHRRAITLRPHYWACYNSLGVFYFQNARYAEAEDLFQQAVSLAPDSYRGFYNLGAVYITDGRYGKAIPVFERSIELLPTELAYSNLGAGHFMLRHFEEAAKAYQQAIDIGDGDYYIWGNLGEAYSRIKRKQAETRDAYGRAVDLAEQELEVNTRDLEVAADLAGYYAVLGEKELATERLKHVIGSENLSADLQFTVALVYNQLGEGDNAIEWLRGALASGFSHTWVRDNPVLDNLRERPEFMALLKH